MPTGTPPHAAHRARVCNLQVLIMRITAFLLLLCTLCPVVADTDGNYLLVLVSQRNGETIAEAAGTFKQQYPTLKVVARTDLQLREQPQQTRQLIDNSSGILGMGLYGPVVEQLQPLLRDSGKPQLIMNSDHRLMALSHWRGSAVFSGGDTLKALAKQHPAKDFQLWLSELRRNYPGQRQWIDARAYWQAGGSGNTQQLFGWFYKQLGHDVRVAAATPVPPLRWLYNGEINPAFPNLGAGEVTLVIDHSGGGRPADSALLRMLCEQLNKPGQCITAIAAWGEAGVQAVAELRAYLRNRPTTTLNGIVMVQDFVIGGGEGREAVTKLLAELNVPVLKAIKLRDRTAAEWQLSADGLAHEKVYYQVAMPELQGASQPLVIATAGEQSLDPVSGIRIQPIRPHHPGLEALAAGIERWQVLQQKNNSHKRVAIVYYNHPPGRHNIGADNLDVPASLWQILQQLKQAGYHTGELPPSPEALLDLLQRQGVNLPNDAKALAGMSGRIQRVDNHAYQSWFSTLPYSIRQEIEFGPFGLLHSQMVATLEAGEYRIGREILEHTFEQMHHLLEGLDHKGRDRALALAQQLEKCYQALLERIDSPCMDDAPALIRALRLTGIEGLAGWGKAPGKSDDSPGKNPAAGYTVRQYFYWPAAAARLGNQ